MITTSEYRELLQGLVDLSDAELTLSLEATLRTHNANTVLISNSALTFDYVYPETDNVLLNNINREARFITHRPTRDFVRLVNEALLSRHPDLFPDPTRYMTAPVILSPGKTPVAVTACSRQLAVRFVLEPNTGAHSGMANEYGLAASVADQVYAEFMTEIQQMPDDQVLYPYMPVLSSLVIDPATFQPVISFKTRYGIGPK